MKTFGTPFTVCVCWTRDTIMYGGPGRNLKDLVEGSGPGGGETD